MNVHNNLSRPVWTQAEFTTLSTLTSWDDVPRVVALLPGRTRTAVVNKARLRGILPNLRFAWSKAEVEALLQTESLDNVPSILADRSRSSCQHKARHLGRSFTPKPRWTEAETTIIRSVKSREEVEQVVGRELPDRTLEACLKKLREFKILPSSPCAPLQPRSKTYINSRERNEWWKAEGREARLRKLMERGVTASAAAIELGVKRGAVSGKWWRMNLLDWHAPPSRVYVLDLVKRYECSWPIGDPGDSAFHFCGAEALIGRSYCAEHMRIGYTVINGKRAA